VWIRLFVSFLRFFIDYWSNGIIIGWVTMLLLYYSCWGFGVLGWGAAFEAFKGEKFV
jgi:hypothetical protein